jgi:hypothetical protein
MDDFAGQLRLRPICAAVGSGNARGRDARENHRGGASGRRCLEKVATRDSVHGYPFSSTELRQYFG